MARPKKKTEQNIAAPAAPAPEKKVTTKKDTTPAKTKSPAKSTIKDGTFLIQSNGKD